MIVVDCSAVVDVLTGVSGAESLRQRLGEEQLHAPELLDYEVVAGLRGLTLGRHLASDRAVDALGDFGDLDIQRWPATHALRRRAFDLRDQVSAYDAAYVVLAEALECRLVTRDQCLARAVESMIDVEVR